MNKENHLLTEVMCAFWFDQNQNSWDSTYFGKFFELIESEGYNEKEEQKNFQIQFELKSNDLQNPGAKSDELPPKMVFRNKEKNYAIILTANFISFHKLAPYESWEKMLEEQIIPGLEKYFQMRLGKGLLQVQMLYLNNYAFPTDTNFSDHFHFLPLMDKLEIGTEKSINFISQYELEPNLLSQIRLHTLPDNNQNKGVFLECSCLSFNKSQSEDWKTLAQQAHDTNNKIFNIITR